MKNKVNLVIAFILGIIISNITVYAVTIINSKDVIFDNSKNNMISTNVKDAVDELYSISKFGNASESDILYGKSALVGGKKVEGKIKNLGNWSITPTSPGIVNIPNGYHNGFGTIDTTKLQQILYIEHNIQQMQRDNFIIREVQLKPGKGKTIDVGFVPSYMVIAYRNANESIDRVGLGYFDFNNKQRYLYWAPNVNYEQSSSEFYNNISNITSTSFYYTNSATTEHYVIMFIYP